MEGNIDAYRTFILRELELSDANNTPTILVLDLDNTIINTTAALDRAAELTRRRLSEKYNK